MKETVWNAKQLDYAKGLRYDDFVVRRENPIVVRSSSPVNTGSQPTWAYRNMLTKDVGSELYLAYITLFEGGGHDYHAHSGWEAIYMLKGRVQFTYQSVGGEDIQTVLEPGDAVFVPHGVPHSFWNMEKGESEFLVMKIPPFFLENIPLPSELQEKSFKPKGEN